MNIKTNDGFTKWLPVIHGYHMISGTRCPAQLLSRGGGVRAGQRTPKGQCPRTQ